MQHTSLNSSHLNTKTCDRDGQCHHQEIYARHHRHVGWCFHHCGNEGQSWQACFCSSRWPLAIAVVLPVIQQCGHVVRVVSDALKAGFPWPRGPLQRCHLHDDHVSRVPHLRSRQPTLQSPGKLSVNESFMWFPCYPGLRDHSKDASTWFS